MWNGVFSIPEIAKHRDFEHGSFAEHAAANGGKVDKQPVEYEGRTDVLCDTDPITEKPLTPPQRYCIVVLELPNGKRYPYLIKPSSTSGKPTLYDIRTQIDQYAKNPVEGGRRIEDYIVVDENSLIEELLNG